MAETQKLFSKEQSEVLFRVYDFLIKLADEEQEETTIEPIAILLPDTEKIIEQSKPEILLEKG